ncbi:hypothetical protein FHX81_2256 [Saccharothrix saharensis]|uniref:Uncharacterized protein n=1 Tax=Saccharothrix saharensis TaxID=571190 RepID=A0A543JAT1_9PSEU|nr:hypothetical protein FHX81_2256 [Saccharothrix saharensis]
MADRSEVVAVEGAADPLDRPGEVDAVGDGRAVGSDEVDPGVVLAVPPAAHRGGVGPGQFADPTGGLAPGRRVGWVGRGRRSLSESGWSTARTRFSSVSRRSSGGQRPGGAVCLVASGGGWALGNCRQVGPVWRGAGSMPASCRIRQTVEAAMRWPRPASSPRVRRRPHRGTSPVSRGTSDLIAARVSAPGASTCGVVPLAGHEPAVPGERGARRRHRSMVVRWPGSRRAAAWSSGSRRPVRPPVEGPVRECGSLSCSRHGEPPPLPRPRRRPGTGPPRS